MFKETINCNITKVQFALNYIDTYDENRLKDLFSNVKEIKVIFFPPKKRYLGYYDGELLKVPSIYDKNEFGNDKMFSGRFWNQCEYSNHSKEFLNL